MPFKRARSLIIYLIFLTFILTVRGCGKAYQETGVREDDVCNLENFSEFFTKFSRSINFKKTHTIFPLQRMYVDGATDPEPLSIEQLLISSNEVISPLFPGRKVINSMDVALSFSVLHGTAEVSINNPDTDYLIKYFFEHNQCWGLFRIEDSSL